MVLTSNDLTKSGAPRCEVCARVAFGGVLGADANGKRVGVCCASKALKAQLREMIPADAEPEEENLDAYHLSGGDPLAHGKGADPRAARILYWIARKGQITGNKVRYRQATPDVVKEVVEENAEFVKRQQQQVSGNWGTAHPIAFPVERPDGYDEVEIDPGFAGPVALPPRTRTLRGPLRK